MPPTFKSSGLSLPVGKVDPCAATTLPVTGFSSVNRSDARRRHDLEQGVTAEVDG